MYKKILFLIVIFIFFTFSSVSFAINYGSGLYGSDLYSATIPSATASPNAGTYNTNQFITLTTQGSNTIRYSTIETPADCTSGTLYTIPILISSSQTIYTLACDIFNNSTPLSFVYIISISSSSGSYLPGYGPNGIITNNDGCTSGNLFSSTTGKSCGNNIVIPATNSSSISEIQKVIKDLKYGMTNKDVKTLQLFLIAQDKGLNAKVLAKYGGTNYFGKLTKASLAEWQKVNNIKPAVGYFGKITRAKIKLLGL